MLCWEERRSCEYLRCIIRPWVGEGNGGGMEGGRCNSVVPRFETRLKRGPRFQERLCPSRLATNLLHHTIFFLISYMYYTDTTSFSLSPMPACYTTRLTISYHADTTSFSSLSHANRSCEYSLWRTKQAMRLSHKLLNTRTSRDGHR